MEPQHDSSPWSVFHKVRTGVEHVEIKLRSEKIRIAFFFVLYWSSLIAVFVTILVWALMLSSLSTRSAFYGIIVPHVDLPTGLPYYKYSWLIEEADTPSEAEISLVPLPKSAYAAAASLWDWDYLGGQPVAGGSSFGLFKQATARLSADTADVAACRETRASAEPGGIFRTKGAEGRAPPSSRVEEAETKITIKFENFTLDLRYLNFHFVLSTAKMASMKMNAFTTYIRIGDDKEEYEPTVDQVTSLQRLVDTIEDKVVKPLPPSGSCTVMPPNLEGPPPPSVIPHPTDCPWDQEI